MPKYIIFNISKEERFKHKTIVLYPATKITLNHVLFNGTDALKIYGLVNARVIHSKKTLLIGLWDLPHKKQLIGDKIHLTITLDTYNKLLTEDTIELPINYPTDQDK